MGLSQIGPAALLLVTVRDLTDRRAAEEHAAARARLEREDASLREEARALRGAEAMVGSSRILARIREQIALVAPTDATVLVLGESGTGKELVARAIHEGSDRAAGRLVKVNCGSIPRELFESEFFGHTRGAFTGAVQDRIGRFELADGGTLFLDEVGEIPLDLQVKLLRVLQEGEFERVGDHLTRRVDVRVVAATNRDLQTDARAGRFRQDLLYRLSVFPIEVPPLRQRTDDLLELVEHFVHEVCDRLGRRPRPISPEDLKRLEAHAWPGNVRELQNVVERSVILSGPDTIELSRGLTSDSLAAPPSSSLPPSKILTAEDLDRLERQSVRAALRQCGGRIYGVEGAAAMLGLKPTTLASRIKRRGILDKP